MKPPPGPLTLRVAVIAVSAAVLMWCGWAYSPYKGGMVTVPIAVAALICGGFAAVGETSESLRFAFLFAIALAVSIALLFVVAQFV